jgi:hypothetical protein
MTDRDVDHVPTELADTLAAKDKSFDQVRVIEQGGRLSAETWSKIRTWREGGDVIAELSGPHIGNAPPIARRREVTADRLVLDGGPFMQALAPGGRR